MSATVHHIRPVKPDPLAELHAERERLGADLQRFAVVDERLAAAGAKIAEIDAALGELDDADRRAIEAWAETAEGEPPAPLLAERKALMARRLDAEAERQAAEIAIGAVAAKRTALIHEMNRAGVHIREQQFAAALDEGRRIHAEAQALAAELAGRLMRLMGLRQAVFSMMTEASNRHDADQGRVFNGALSEVDALQHPDILADPATVETHTRQWLEKIR